MCLMHINLFGSMYFGVARVIVRLKYKHTIATVVNTPEDLECSRTFISIDNLKNGDLPMSPCDILACMSY